MSVLDAQKKRGRFRFLALDQSTVLERIDQLWKIGLFYRGIDIKSHLH